MEIVRNILSEDKSINRAAGWYSGTPRYLHGCSIHATTRSSVRSSIHVSASRDHGRDDDWSVANASPDKRVITRVHRT